jgi:predicted nucleotide-binding protein (sugar kinase/HSP70/actin superfamily)
LKWLAAKLLDVQTDKFLQRLNKALSRFPHAIPLTRPRLLADQARPILSLTNQYGEGWLLTGEMVELAEQGIDNILCVQPFGCIANQVVAKGIEKRLRELHPTVNILFIDMDHNVSAANVLNRLHFLVRGAQSTMAASCGTEHLKPAAPQSRRAKLVRGVSRPVRVGIQVASVVAHEVDKVLDGLVDRLRPER